MTGSRGFANALGFLGGIVCTAAWGQTAVLSVRLEGYRPNTYGQCRPISGLGNGTGVACSSSSDCPVGETCGQLFRDVSCTGADAAGDAQCLAKIGGPSKCVATVVFPTVPPTTAFRCSAVSVAPQGMVLPGDTLFLEVFADEWDQTPGNGKCENGSNSCGMNDPAPCKSCRRQTIPAAPPGPPCHTNADCAPPNSCLEDRHCANSGIRCEGTGVAFCAFGEPCVPDACEAWPAIGSYQWRIDSSQFSNGTGPGSVLIPGNIPCTFATQLDDCRHGYVTGCVPCSVGSCGFGNICEPFSNAFVNTSRLDYVFSFRVPQVACSVASDDYTCGGALGGGNSVVDDGAPKYLGTAMVKVSAGACGTFRVGLLDDSLSTFMNDQFGIRVPGLTINPATISISPRPTCVPACTPDGNLCTQEVCNCSNLCVHVPVVSCDGDAYCNPNTGLCELCGNGIIEGSEDCDDKGESESCDADCTFTECGDDTLNETAGEECDGIYDDACGGPRCRPNCTCAPPTCGDGIRDEGEACDGDDNEMCAGRHCKTDCTCSIPRPHTPVPLDD